jgi:hypothetical protein
MKFTKFRLLFILLPLFLLFGFCFTGTHFASGDNGNWYWTGGGTDGTCGGAGTANNWSCGANWDQGIIPPSHVLTYVFFNSGSSKDATIDSDFSIDGGLLISDGYTGTITLGSGVTLTIGSSNGFTQEDGTFDASAGTFDVQDGSDFAMSGGTFTPPSGTWDVTGHFDFTGGTLNGSGKTVNLTGLNSVVSCTGDLNAQTGLTFNIQSSHSDGNFGLSGGCLLNAVMNTISTGTTTIRGTFTTSSNWHTEGGVYVGSGGTLNLNGSTVYMGEGLSIQGGADPATVNASSVSNFTIDDNFGGGHSLSLGTFGAAATFNAPVNLFLPLNGSVSTVGDGTILNAGSGTITSANDLTNNGGTFNAGTGTVILDGTDQKLTGDWTFNNFTDTVTTASTLTFDDSATITILGGLTLHGTSGNILFLRSLNDNSQWKIDPHGSKSVAYVDVKDSDNINATAISAASTGSINSGNNTNWNFGAATPTPSSSSNQGGGSSAFSVPSSSNPSPSPLPVPPPFPTTPASPSQSSQPINQTVAQNISKGAAIGLDIVSGRAAITGIPVRAIGPAGGQGVNADVWTGQGSDANWSTSANWLYGRPPDFSDVAVFEYDCLKNCSPIINVDINIKGILLANQIILRQAKGVNITLANYAQIAGHFIGGNGLFQDTGDFAIAAGIFTPTSGTWNVEGSFTLGAAARISDSGVVVSGVPDEYLLSYVYLPDGEVQGDFTYQGQQLVERYNTVGIPQSDGSTKPYSSRSSPPNIPLYTAVNQMYLQSLPQKPSPIWGFNFHTEITGPVPAGEYFATFLTRYVGFVTFVTNADGSIVSIASVAPLSYGLGGTYYIAGNAVISKGLNIYNQTLYGISSPDFYWSLDLKNVSITNDAAGKPSQITGQVDFVTNYAVTYSSTPSSKATDPITFTLGQLDPAAPVSYASLSIVNFNNPTAGAPSYLVLYNGQILHIVNSAGAAAYKYIIDKKLNGVTASALPDGNYEVLLADGTKLVFYKNGQQMSGILDALRNAPDTNTAVGIAKAAGLLVEESVTSDGESVNYLVTESDGTFVADLRSENASTAIGTPTFLGIKSIPWSQTCKVNIGDETSGVTIAADGKVYGMADVPSYTLSSNCDNAYFKCDQLSPADYTGAYAAADKVTAAGGPPYTETYNGNNINVVWLDANPVSIFGDDRSADADSNALRDGTNVCTIHLYKPSLGYIAASDPGIFTEILTHEIGHCMGLDHSSDPSSIMYPYIKSGVDTFSADDLTVLGLLKSDQAIPTKQCDVIYSSLVCSDPSQVVIHDPQFDIYSCQKQCPGGKPAIKDVNGVTSCQNACTGGTIPITNPGGTTSCQTCPPGNLVYQTIQSIPGGHIVLNKCDNACQTSGKVKDITGTQCVNSCGSRQVVNPNTNECECESGAVYGVFGLDTTGYCINAPPNCTSGFLFGDTTCYPATPYEPPGPRGGSNICYDLPDGTVSCDCGTGYVQEGNECVPESSIQIQQSINSTAAVAANSTKGKTLNFTGSIPTVLVCSGNFDSQTGGLAVNVNKSPGAKFTLASGCTLTPGSSSLKSYQKFETASASASTAISAAPSAKLPANNCSIVSIITPSLPDAVQGAPYYG